MNPADKKATKAGATPRPHAAQAGRAPEVRHAVARPNAVAPARGVTRPAAPAVYRPQAKPASVQAKAAVPSQSKNHPAAPPAYRPQSAPRVLQTKKTIGQPSTRPHTGHRPVAPPAHSPASRRPENSARPVPQNYGATSSPRATVVQRSVAAKPVQASTKVTLYIGGQAYTGVSSGQYGHAEMEALRKFIISCDSLDDAQAQLDAATKTVSCIRIPVCVSCSTVLQALDFTANEPETEFDTKQSGGVGWGGNLKVEEFMKHVGKKDKYDEAKKKGFK